MTMIHLLPEESIVGRILQFPKQSYFDERATVQSFSEFIGQNKVSFNPFRLIFTISTVGDNRGYLEGPGRDWQSDRNISPSVNSGKSINHGIFSKPDESSCSR